eukprot:6516405-Pyramimonas_sp.AAC.2
MQSHQALNHRARALAARATRRAIERAQTTPDVQDNRAGSMSQPGQLSSAAPANAGHSTTRLVRSKLKIPRQALLVPR